MSVGSTDRGDRGWVAAVVHRIQDGERLEQDYERLFREYEPAVRRFLLHKGVPEPQVDDLVQDVLLRAYRGIASFRFESSFGTWMLRITVNVWKNALREQGTLKPEARWTSLDDDGLQPDHAGEPSEPRLAGPDPLHLTLAAERRRRMEAALDQLPPAMRRCLLLHSFGYKNEEIAHLLRVAVGTVKKQVQKGHKRLRDLLDPAVELFGLSLLLILLLH